MLGPSAEQEPPLPALRQDLKLHRTSADEDGAPRWLVHDPVSQKFYTLSHTALYFFRHWKAGVTPTQFIADINAQGVEASEEDLTYFSQFISQNNLIKVQGPQAVDGLVSRYKATQKHWFSWLIHNYLFIKVPLFKPDAFLTAIFPYLKWLFSPWVGRSIMVMGVIGLFLTLRQWETFLSTFEYFFSTDGLLAYGLTLVVVKSLHELGHAVVAKRYHCKVASMGLAFLVLFPVLYTDTTDAWRLRSKWQRLSIVMAGVKVELYLALIATFLWSFLPDGSLKSVAFFVATTSWVSSVLINISPFLRFDGYYALSDWSSVENLQPRAFAVGRWYLRRLLFGLKETPPEPVNPFKVRFFVSYAWFTWVYRFFLFLGIAVLVYYFAFKVLGIILFVVEIMWFIVLPISKEVQRWIKMKEQFTMNKNVFILFTTLALLIGGLVFPWQSSLSVPGVMTAEHYARVYAPNEGQIVALNAREGQKVVAGDVMMLLHSDKNAQDIAIIEKRIAAVDEKLRRVVSSVDDMAAQAVLMEELNKLKTEYQSYLDVQARLVVRAPIDGVVKQALETSEGAYVNKDDLVFGVMSHAWSLKAYVTAENLKGIEEGLKASLIADDGKRIDATFVVSGLRTTAVEKIPYQELASTYGGGIAARQKEQEGLVAEQAVYQVSFYPQNIELHREQRLTGQVILETTPESYLSKIFFHAYAVILRESGF